MKVNLISLGCAKNLVDTEVLGGILGKAGFEFVGIPQYADFMIINTCSFIKEAREESYREISKLCASKKENQKLIICGCLPQLEKETIFRKFPQVDAIIGSTDFFKIGKVIKKLDRSRRVSEVSSPRFLYDSSYPRLLSTPRSYAYLKIAEGCSNRCGYCKIPYLRGNYRSRSIDDIVTEARTLAGMGIKEIILVAHDTTDFGSDRGADCNLPRLLDELHEIKKIKWIRILYMHPAHITRELVETISRLPRVARYFDIPLQHLVSGILRRMKRPSFNRAENLIGFIRKTVPAAIRTTFITGFPGETAGQFGRLLSDVKRIKFDWAGVFAYSDEKGTPAYMLDGKVTQLTAGKRAEALMKMQRGITFRKNKTYAGRTLKVLVDGPFTGHTEFQAPVIDGKVIFAKKQKPGTMKKFMITGARGYDLIAG
ncbi:MAG: 30S ribosomal protein S12 methylthiotransferase RimO [bacterium]